MAQITEQRANPASLSFSGQVSTWVNVNSAGDLPVWAGVRYIPQAGFRSELKTSHTIDAEFSANIYGSAGLRPFDSLFTTGNLKPYRFWARYSANQFEIRVGLQKLNFGSASMLRPLMWFDQMDPRDPLQLTDGVWGILGRYYFINNANIWLWGLYGNNAARGWDAIPSAGNIPEFGGRLQLPVTSGEIAFTYHHRTADSRSLGGIIPGFRKIPENKYGFDAKWDLVAGIWVEGSITSKGEELGALTNQALLNAGADYTFGIGSGLYMAYEQLVVSNDDKPLAFSNSLFFSIVTASYPLGMFDQLSTIIYYNWKGGNLYSFLNWKRQFDNTMLYVMVYRNPEIYDLPSLSRGQNIFAGKGIQIMFVFNH
jgi:hypothetical protein